MHNQLAQKVKVWDAPVRLFHWSLVILIGTLWYSAEQGEMDLHVKCAYAVLTLLLFRILWGFVGSPHARFSDFIYGPHRVIAYLQSQGQDGHHYVGHNPAGGWSVMMLLLLVFLQISSGFFATDEVLTEGPWFSWVSSDTASILTRIHKLGFNILLLFVVLHVGAVLFYFIVKREDLIHPMLHGKKKLPAEVAAQERQHSFAPLWLAAVLLALSAGLVYLLVMLPTWL